MTGITKGITFTLVINKQGTQAMKTETREKAIKAYKEIAEGKVKGVKMHQSKVIKVGSISFIID